MASEWTLLCPPLLRCHACSKFRVKQLQNAVHFFSRFIWCSYIVARSPLLLHCVPVHRYHNLLVHSSTAGHLRLFPFGAVISQTTLIMRVSVSLCVHECASKCVCMKLCVYFMFYCNKASECFVSFCGHTTSSWCCLSPQVTVSICGCGGKAVRKPMPLSSETTHLCSSLLLYKSNYLRCSSNPRVSWELQLWSPGEALWSEGFRAIVFSVSESTHCCRSQGFCCCVETPWLQ